MSNWWETGSSLDIIGSVDFLPGGSMRRKARLLVLAPLLSVALLAPAGGASAASDRLPDLAMAKLQRLTTDNTGGRRLLRFSSIIVNIGAGPMEIHSQRATTSSSWSSQQVVYDDAGGSRMVATPGVELIYGGDGHNHWHVKDLERYRLVPLSGGGERVSQKAGFCFFDNYQYKLSLPGAPQSAQYPRSACGNQTSRTLRHGLSVGWGDNYQWSLPDQYIDTTGLPNGNYRLWATADQADLFQESNNANNSTWADLRMDANGVTVLRKAPNP
jgi:Lysyl oxidase